MLRRTIMLAFFLGLIPLSCGPKDKHYEIRSIELAAYSDEQGTVPVTESDTIYHDTVYISIRFQVKYTAQLAGWLETRCFATTKSPPGYKGPKDQIESIVLTSDNVFAGRPPGTDLSFLCTDYRGRSDGFASLVTEMNGPTRGAAGPRSADGKSGDLFWGFQLEKKPGNTLRHTLTLTFTRKSGEVHRAQILLRWKQ